MNKDKELIDKHVERKEYNAEEPWKWGLNGYSGYSCKCGCGLTLKDLQQGLDF